MTQLHHYGQARQAFLDAARRADARVDSVGHPMRGLQGEALGLDMAWVGSRRAQRVVVSMAGTHGVEGFLGSACQVAALEEAALGRLPPDTALMFLHGVNPYGFSWMRRVDHRNVDVNHNGIDFSAPAANADYTQVHALLTPETWTDQSAEVLQQGLAAAGQRLGRAGLARAVLGGQYTHPDGLFFGGLAPCWSHDAVHTLVKRHLGHARALCVLDHHTGLGAVGHTELICGHPAGSEALNLARQWWGGDVKSPAADEWACEVMDGNLRMAFKGWCPDAQVLVTVALEVGTRPALQVLTALVADHWLHRQRLRDPEVAAQIRQQMQQAFFVDTPAWRQRSVARGLQVLLQALEGLQALELQEA